MFSSQQSGGDIIACERNIKLHFTFHTAFRWLEKRGVCQPGLDVDAANVAPGCLAAVGQNQRGIACWQLSRGKKGWQLCDGTSEVRQGWQIENFWWVVLLHHHCDGIWFVETQWAYGISSVLSIQNISDTLYIGGETSSFSQDIRRQNLKCFRPMYVRFSASALLWLRSADSGERRSRKCSKNPWKNRHRNKAVSFHTFNQETSQPSPSVTDFWQSWRLGDGKTAGCHHLHWEKNSHQVVEGLNLNLLAQLHQTPLRDG